MLQDLVLDICSLLMERSEISPKPELVQILPKFDLDPGFMNKDDLKPIPRPELVKILHKDDLKPIPKA